MARQAQHLPASASAQVEFRVELLIADLQATPGKGTTRGRSVGAESSRLLDRGLALGFS